ncbi:MAG: hypothetical protein SF069_13590 [Phycisphaerae bacterium]|nr:hypothetical protein [Phycisphaerae bacterium]
MNNARRAAFAAASLLLLAPACAYRITPPVNPPSPTEVFVIDYGQHSGLVLPAESGELREYAYGEWEWFAKNNQGWWRGPAILIVPSAGTLGVRPSPLSPDELTRAAAMDSPRSAIAGVAEEVHEVRVEAARVAELRKRLDAALMEKRDESHFNPEQGMLFVPDPRRYSMCFHCNSAIAEWLRALGCEVHGLGGIADFEVEKASNSPAAVRSAPASAPPR